MSSFKHECTEWDFMEIDATDAEFLACSCFSGDAEYEAVLQGCAQGWHPEGSIIEQWSYEGSLDVPNGTRDFKVKTCTFCGEEWT